MQMKNGLQKNLLKADETEKQMMVQFAFEDLCSSEIVGGAVFATTDVVRMVYGTETFFKILGYTAEEYEKHALLFLRKIYMEEQIYVLREAVKASTTEEPQLNYHCETKTKDGRPASIEIGIRYMERVQDTSYYYVTMRQQNKDDKTLPDVGMLTFASALLSDMKRMENEQIENLRMRDQLTGLLNREAFCVEVEKYLKEASQEQTYAIVYSDMNGFEYINGNFGYAAGDRMLLDYAHMLEKDRAILFTCRVYSDYFLTFHAGENQRDILEHVKDMNQKFLKAQRENYPLNNLSIATGICYMPKIETEKEADIFSLIEDANMARKEAKTRRGNHTTIYDAQLRRMLEQEQQVAGKLEDAIKNGEIELFLQPKFSLENRKVIGAEALVRWKNKDGTYHLPKEFIPALEKTGYITQLDFYIYEQVLKNLKKWKGEKKVLLPISVNFSRAHTESGNFVRQIIRLADYYEVERSLVEIEITESTLSDNNSRMMCDMAMLQKAGFKVDIDDFGTGYSSLNMLLRAPVDTVKMDKSFLTDVSTSEKQREYVSCIAKLIGAEDKDIIFEGVETEQQAKIIADYGYTKVQGFLFGKPMPVVQFDRMYMMPEFFMDEMDSAS